MTPNKGKVYLWSLVEIITQESLAIVEIPGRVSSGAKPMSNESIDKIYIIWARFGITSLVGATLCPFSKPSGGIDW